MLSTRTVMRSERSRSSRVSTKPEMSTFHTAAGSTGCAMIARLIVAVAKAGSDGRDPERSGECERPVSQQDRGDDQNGEQRGRRPRRRLLVDGKIDDDAAAERDRQPRNQPARTDLSRHPVAERCAAPRAKSARPSGHTKPGLPPAAGQESALGRHVVARPRAPPCSTMRGPPPAPHLPYRSPHRAKRNAGTGLFSLRSVELIQRRLMQYPNLSQVFLRFFDVVPYGVELIPDRNLASTVQRGFKALDAKHRTSGKGIPPLYFFADRHWFDPQVCRNQAVKRASVFGFSCFAFSVSATRFRRWLT